MSRICQVTGAKPGFGHHVSHSHRRTNRRFDVNIQSKRYWVPSLDRAVTLTGSHVRPKVELRSTAGTGYTYVTQKNRRNDPDRLVLRTYDPRVRRHVTFREER